MRGATRLAQSSLLLAGISIHAPHAGCDVCPYCGKRVRPNFNPRTPCGVRRHAYASTVSGDSDFNPRTPCGVRRARRGKTSKRSGFQSTHPMRGATGDRRAYQRYASISIHAPHAGCDSVRSINLSKISYFNPRTPCGVRPFRLSRWISCRTFQSTHPMRGATFKQTPAKTRAKISIHAPHAGCDKDHGRGGRRGRDFNPRTPCGVRQAPEGEKEAAREFQSTHPMRGATPSSSFLRRANNISIHAPHAGCDRCSRSVR